MIQNKKFEMIQNKSSSRCDMYVHPNNNKRFRKNKMIQKVHPGVTRMYIQMTTTIKT